MVIGEEPKVLTMMVKFLMIDLPFAYNRILGQSLLNAVRAVILTLHKMIKFSTWEGVGQVWGDQKTTRACYFISIYQGRITESCPFDRP